MGDESILDRISALAPQEFENLTFDLMKAVGLRNVVWRTPGADGGRDIEGLASIKDLSGHESSQKWYVECKRYSQSLDWPTVYGKVAYADVQGADILLVVTNSNASPACETKISEWNSAKRRPVIRFWRGYDLPSIIRQHSGIAVAYGLADSPDAIRASVFPLSMIIQKLVQSAYGSAVFGGVGDTALEAAAAITELLSRRIVELESYGRLLSIAGPEERLHYPWLGQTGNASAWDTTGLRSVVAYARHVTGATRGDIDIEPDKSELTFSDVKYNIIGRAEIDLVEVSRWGKVEVTCVPGTKTIALLNRVHPQGVA